MTDIEPRVPTGGKSRDSILRVAFFGNFLSRSLGGRSVCEDLADHFEARGMAVIRASPQLNPVRRLLGMLATAAFRCRNYDVAYVDLFSGRGFVWAECVCLLLRILRKPFVLMLRGGGLPDFGDAHPRRVQRLLGSAPSVVAPSRYLSDAMRCYREDIEVLPNAVDVPAYRGRVRGPLSPRLVWLRSFHAIYNPCLAVRVLATVVRSYPEATLVMVGPDKGDGSVEGVLREANRLGVSDRVRLIGGLPKAVLPSLLEKNDIFLNTANIDNTPITVIEAMASGLCIVTTEVGGIRVLCSDQRNALIVRPDDPEEMSGACLRLLNDPDLAMRMSRNALEDAQAYDRGPMMRRL
jgi:glycosyltransferase involved in cell wall biosynthesis